MDCFEGSITIKHLSILSIILSLVILFTGIIYNDVYAHNEIQIGNFTISAGWETEPPLLNVLNNIVMEVTKSDSTPVRNALLNTIIDIRFGGLTKELGFMPSEESPSIYTSPIIPKSLGSYSIEINGMIENQKTTGEIQIEDVEDPIKISFPNLNDNNEQTADNQQTSQIGKEVKSIITKLSSDIEETKNDINFTKNTVQGSIKATKMLLTELDKAYLLGFIALAIGIVSITLSISKKSRLTSK